MYDGAGNGAMDGHNDVLPRARTMDSWVTEFTELIATGTGKRG